MFSSTYRRLAFTSLLVAFLATTSFAQHKTPASRGSFTGPGTAAVVTTASNVDIHIDQFQLRESPGGHWITERPNRFATELHYRIQKDGVTFRNAIPFSAIESIEFTTFVSDDAMYPEVRKMLITLRDGGNLEWIHADKSMTITAPDGKKEQWQSFAWISGVVSSGEKEQGQDYVLTGFTGLAKSNGKQGKWEAAPVDIKRIRFVGSK